MQLEAILSTIWTPYVKIEWNIYFVLQSLNLRDFEQSQGVRPKLQKSQSQSQN